MDFDTIYRIFIHYLWFHADEKCTYGVWRTAWPQVELSRKPVDNQCLVAKWKSLVSTPDKIHSVGKWSTPSWYQCRYRSIKGLRTMDSILLVKQTRFLPWISFFPRSQSWRGFKKFNSQLKTKELLGPQSSTYTQACHLSTCARESPIGNLNQSWWAFMTLFRRESQYSSTACTKTHAQGVYDRSPDPTFTSMARLKEAQKLRRMLGFQARTAVIRQQKRQTT